MGPLRREHPCARHAAQRGRDGEDPEGQRTDTEEIGGDVLGEPRNEIDDETEDGALGVADESQLVPRFPPDQAANVAGSQQAAHSKGCEGADGEADGRVAESAPLTEQVAAEKASRLSGNRRHDDLERLKSDEEHRGEHPNSSSTALRNGSSPKNPDPKPEGRAADTDNPHPEGEGGAYTPRPAKQPEA